MLVSQVIVKAFESDSAGPLVRRNLVRLADTKMNGKLDAGGIYNIQQPLSNHGATGFLAYVPSLFRYTS
jgi:hypothetical protein